MKLINIINLRWVLVTLMLVACNGNEDAIDPKSSAHLNGDMNAGADMNAGVDATTDVDAATGVPSDNKCGGAVNSSGDAEAQCQQDLWGPTGDRSMHCFAYGGAGDPCHLSNTNDLFSKLRR